MSADRLARVGRGTQEAWVDPEQVVAIQGRSDCVNPSSVIYLANGLTLNVRGRPDEVVRKLNP